MSASQYHDYGVFPLVLEMWQKPRTQIVEWNFESIIISLLEIHCRELMMSVGIYGSLYIH